MSETDSSSWVLPAGIPFAELKARDLKECVYWLLDAMGARDLEWRTGGSGGGAPDGGRDLEATFYVPSPDGEMDPQRWWIECKGRKGTVEPDEVKSAVNNATAHGDLANLVFVTNTTFSNPTRDWVKSWQAAHPRPRVRLWDHEMLERLLSKHSSVVLRLFSEALSPAGLLKAAQERFWSKLEYIPAKALRTFWTARESMEVDALARFALIANESAHGSIVDRPWAASASAAELHLAFSNLPYLRIRVSKVGVDEEPILAALAHLIVTSFQVISADQLTTLIMEAGLSHDGNPFPDESSRCCSCPSSIGWRARCRMSARPTAIASSGLRRRRWSAPSTRCRPIGGAWIRQTLRRSPIKGAFSAWNGMTAPARWGSPLYEVSPTATNVAAFLSVIERVSEFRLVEAREKAAAEREKRARSAPARA